MHHRHHHAMDKKSSLKKRREAIIYSYEMTITHREISRMREPYKYIFIPSLYLNEVLMPWSIESVRGLHQCIHY